MTKLTKKKIIPIIINEKIDTIEEPLAGIDNALPEEILRIEDSSSLYMVIRNFIDKLIPEKKKVNKQRILNELEKELPKILEQYDISKQK